MNWGDFNFLYFLPIGFALGLLLYFLENKNKLKIFNEFKSWELINKMIPELSFFRKKLKIILFSMGIIFFIIALARPRYGEKLEKVKVNGLDVVLVLDVSNSMEVEDVVPSRLRKAKHWIRTLSERLEGDRLGLVVFGGSAYLASPLTTDIQYLLDTVEIAGPTMILNQGTDFGIALESAVNAIERASEDTEKGLSQGSTSKVLIMISDGEDHIGDYKNFANRIKELGVTTFFIGVGSEKGGPIPQRDSDGILRGYRRDSAGQPIVSQFSSKALKDLAGKLGGGYYQMSSNEGEIDEIAKNIGGLSRGSINERQIVTYTERFQIPLAIGIVLLILDLLVSPRKSIVVIFLMLSSLNVNAGEISSVHKNNSAVDALQKDELQNAEELFADAMIENPDSKEIQYNQGVLQFQKKDFQSATKNFQEYSKKSSDMGDHLGASRGYYNEAMSRIQTKEFDRGVKALLRSIDEAKKSENLEMERKSRDAISALFQEQQQQQQQQKQDQENQNKDPNKDPSKDSQEKNDQGDDKGKDSDQEKKKDGDQPYSQKPKFKSEKLNIDDAKKVMADLSDREKELQKRMKRQKGRQTPKAENGKDW